jgi:hypothetical protein
VATLFGIRPEERGLVAWSSLVLALASAAATMVAAGADAMFLSTLGAGWLGLAVAGSSALLAVVLAVVGAFADRLDRPRLLAGLAAMSAIVVAVIAATATAAPAAAAVLAMIGGKQLAAAVDLAFWVVIAERFDARQSARLVPVITAAGGIGAVVGASVVVLVAELAGPTGCLIAGAIALVLCAAIAPKLVGKNRVVVGDRKSPGQESGRPRHWYGRSGFAVAGRGAWRTAARAWAEGARAARRNPLAGRLAVVVALAGAFASLAYFALGATAAEAHREPGELAGFLGVVRGAVQIVMLVVQLAITPRLLAQLGTGRTLVVAPLAASAAAVALVVDPILAVAVLAQAQARVLDGAVETPAEKLAQALLPVEVRGRVAGFLDGAAKRSGALLGGLVAAVLVGRPLYAVTAVMAVAWLYAAARLARRLPALAVSAVAQRPDAPDAAAAEDAVDARAIGLLLRELEGSRPERAASVLGRLHHRGKVDAVPALLRAVDRMVAAAAGVFSISDRALASDPGRLARVKAGGLGAALPPAPNPELEAVAAIAIKCAAEGTRAPLAGMGDLLATMLDRALAGAATTPRDRELVVRLCGLCGIAPAIDEAARARIAAREPALALTLELAGRRATGDVDGLLATATDATRADDPAERAAAVRELALEVDRLRAPLGPGASPPGAADAGLPPAALAAGRALVRAIRRRRGDPGSHAAGLDALAAMIGRDRRAGPTSRPPGGAPASSSAAELALLRAELLELVRGWLGAHAPDPIGPIAGRMSAELAAAVPFEPGELAAALRLGGELLAAAPELADIRLLVDALGDRDDEVRGAAEAAIAKVGGPAVGELLTTVAYGRRAARDHAARLLAALPVTRAELDAMIEAELDALDRSCVHAGAVGGLGAGWTVRRLDERGREIAHTVLLLVAARERSRALPLAARAWRHALDPASRARALAIIDAALPRELVGRVVEPVDELPALERSRRVAARLGVPPLGRDAAIRAELAGPDRLARALVLDGLGAAGRAAHRDAIAAAAAAAAERSSPAALLRRIAGSDDADAELDADVETRVETLIVLGKVALFAQLTTRQLADVAERARWHDLAEDAVVIAAGETVDALWIVVDGELASGDRTWSRDEAIDDLAVVAPRAFAAEVRAIRPSRLIRLDRVDFEELLDDVPGLAPAVCRVLGARAR